MFFKTGDIIIFRKKNYGNLIKSIRTMNLDNDIGIVVEDFTFRNQEMKGFYLLQINDEIKFLPINNLNSLEFYHYTHFDPVCNKIIYQELLNNPKSILDLVYNLYGIKDFNHIRNNYTLKNTNNVGLTNYDPNYINPYALSYLITPIFEYYLVKKLVKKRVSGITNYKFIYWILVIFGMISGRIMSKINGYSNGMQFSGAMIVFFGIILFLEHFYNYSSLKILDLLTLVIGFRIFFTRFSSWLINDIDVKIDPITCAPYDTLLYESIFEGIIPSLLCWIIKDKVQDGHLLLIWVFNYSFFRIIIENYKDSYHDSDFILSRGQIDTIPLIFLSLWIYMTRKNNRKSYKGFFLIIILYLDLCFRAKNFDKERNHKMFNIDLLIKTKKNHGFINDILKNLNSNQKLLINSSMLLFNTYFTNDFERKLLLLLTGSLNLGERYLSGYVTDYFKISYKNINSLNFNLSDLIFNLF